MSTIFVVDDDPCCQKSMVGLLKIAGYQTLCACNGLEALEALQNAASKPSLILLDLSMPLMDGIELLEVLAESTMWASVPVIVITGEGSHRMLDRAKELGAKDVFIKAGFDTDHLFETIQHYMHA